MNILLLILPISSLAAFDILGIKIDKLQKNPNVVMLAPAGIQNFLKILDFRLRGNDAKGDFKAFYETIKICFEFRN